MWQKLFDQHKKLYLKKKMWRNFFIPTTQVCQLVLILTGMSLTSPESEECLCIKESTNASYCLDWECTYQEKACFSKNSSVAMANGDSKNIRELVDGDSLLTIDPKNGELVTTEFIGYLHADSDLKSNFLKIVLDNHQILEVTQDHLLYEKDKGYVLAQKLAIGDKLLTPIDTILEVLCRLGLKVLKGFGVL